MKHNTSTINLDNLSGYNIKTGLGGIRDIELFTQTYQLIVGGKQRKLRNRWRKYNNSRHFLSFHCSLSNFPIENKTYRTVGLYSIVGYQTFVKYRNSNCTVR